jgi:hypothetical protein
MRQLNEQRMSSIVSDVRCALDLGANIKILQSTSASSRLRFGEEAWRKPSANDGWGGWEEPEYSN